MCRGMLKACSWGLVSSHELSRVDCLRLELCAAVPPDSSFGVHTLTRNA